MRVRERRRDNAVEVGRSRAERHREREREREIESESARTKVAGEAEVPGEAKVGLCVECAAASGELWRKVLGG